jgi:hypothetical protein
MDPLEAIGRAQAARLVSETATRSIGAPRKRIASFVKLGSIAIAWQRDYVLSKQDLCAESISHLTLRAPCRL